MANFWVQVNNEPALRQGDLLPGCMVPLFQPGYGTDLQTAQQVPVQDYDLIVLTQSCDLEQGKAPLVALCPILSIAEFTEAFPNYQKKGSWESVRQGRVEGLHLLASPEEPTNNQQALVVVFREVYSLPLTYLAEHATRLGCRWRLESPYLEHFSQAFARFFMRVGLPSSIPSYK